MKKSDLVSKLHKLYPFLKAEQVNDLIDIAFGEISNALHKGKRVEIRGFGSFSTRQRKVQSKFRDSLEEPLALVDKKSVHFKMGKEFFEILNK